MTGRLPEIPRPRVRLERRDVRGPAVAHEGLEITSVARVIGIRGQGRQGGAGFVLARPRRIEVRRAGVLQRRVAVPDQVLRIQVGAVALLALAVLWRMRAGRS
jgi:hypothetical protein